MSVLVLDDQWPTSRKPHFCDVCLGTISADDRYHRQRNVGEDGAYTYKAHALCSAAYLLAVRRLGLYDDEGADWLEDVKPLVLAFFAALTPGAPSVPGAAA